MTATTFARTDRSFLALWWWTVDRTLLGAIAVLALVGVVLIFAASPAVAEVNDLPPLFFVVKHATMLAPAAVLLLVSSMLSHRGVRRVASLLLAFSLPLLFVTLIYGPEIKGSHRWLAIGGLGIQPSEFVKPAFAVVVAAWLARRPGIAGAPSVLGLALIVVSLCLAQPDVGMATTFLFLSAVELFLAGLPWLLLLGLLAAVAVAAWFAYLTLPHVAARVDAFLAPDAMPHQIKMALRAITGGGLLGRGPGEGEAKHSLPDAHSDFIFAVAVEEFGLIACMALIGLFAFILVRVLWRAREAESRFALLAVVGLISTFGLQAFVNIGVNLRLLPTKGMTLPLVSYGGSSLCAVALTLGFTLALLRRPVRGEER